MAIAVAALTARHPKTGGLYVWIRSDFGQWHGFLAFWVYWMGLAIWFPSATMFYMGAALHALGLPETRTYVLAASLLAIWIALGTNLIGMKIGKWTRKYRWSLRVAGQPPARRTRRDRVDEARLGHRDRPPSALGLGHHQLLVDNCLCHVRS